MKLNMSNLSTLNFEVYIQSFIDLLIRCFSLISKKYIGVDRSIDFKRILDNQFVLASDQIVNFFL